MTCRDLSLFAKKWFREWESEPMQYGRATQVMHALIDIKTEDAWSHILSLIEHAQSEDTLKLIGAGPLEDLLRDHADEFIERVESKAASDPKFKIGLSNVWGFTSMSEAMWIRIQNAVKK
jgi:hypothetical protein